MLDATHASQIPLTITQLFSTTYNRLLGYYGSFVPFSTGCQWISLRFSFIRSDIGSSYSINRPPPLVVKIQSFFYFVTVFVVYRTLFRSLNSGNFASSVPWYLCFVAMPVLTNSTLPKDQYQHYIPRFIPQYFQDAQNRPKYAILSSKDMTDFKCPIPTPLLRGFIYQVIYGNLPRSCVLSCAFPKQVKKPNKSPNSQKSPKYSTWLNYLPVKKLLAIGQAPKSSRSFASSKV